MTERRRYHHGDLRHALLEQAERAVLDVGPARLSLRDLARRAGVSHAAPAYHFGDKSGLLTVLAADGFRMLGERLTEALERTGSFLEVAVAYVEFAVERRGYVEVMFRTDLYDAKRVEVVEARAQATEALERGIGSLPREAVGPEPRIAALAAWSLVHGLAELWLGGALRTEDGEDLAATVRAVARFLFDKGEGVPDSATVP
jgi:AcrR family transcriptional regulator